MVVDTHVHFFDYDDALDLRWSWLEPADDWTVTGSMAAVRSRRFTPVELRSEATRLTGLTKCVHVESAHGSANPVDETTWLATLRERHGFPNAAIVRVGVDDPDLDAQLDAHCEYDFVRGVREPHKAAVLGEDRYIDGLRRLGERDLIFEVYCSMKRFGDLARAARRSPDTQIVLEHFGMAPRPSTERFANWCDALRLLAEHENVQLKLSGLGLMAVDWTFDEVMILVDEALMAFGARRCLYGSNFPVDRGMSSYPDGHHAICRACEVLTESEWHAIFVGNAEALYRI